VDEDAAEVIDTVVVVEFVPLVSWVDSLEESASDVVTARLVEESSPSLVVEAEFVETPRAEVVLVASVDVVVAAELVETTGLVVVVTAELVEELVAPLVPFVPLAPSLLTARYRTRRSSPLSL